MAGRTGQQFGNYRLIPLPGRGGFILVSIFISMHWLLSKQFARDEKLMRRDIKPENVLLQDGQALVADFGIARAISGSLGAGGAQRLTETGITLGTPAYMSPEQAVGDRGLDGRSDLYSLACVVYEMLAGEPPFTGPSVQAMLVRRLTEAPRSLREVRDTVPWTVEHAVVKALAKAPADRFATAGLFAQALHSGATTPWPTPAPILTAPTPFQVAAMGPGPAPARKRKPSYATAPH